MELNAHFHSAASRKYQPQTLDVIPHPKRLRGRALALPTSDHRVTGSNPAGGEILPEPKRRFIAQSLSCSPFHRLEMTEILLKGRKTLTHPSIHPRYHTQSDYSDTESTSPSSTPVSMIAKQEQLVSPGSSLWPVPQSGHSSDWATGAGGKKLDSHIVPCWSRCDNRWCNQNNSFFPAPTCETKQHSTQMNMGDSKIENGICALIINCKCWNSIPNNYL